MGTTVLLTEEDLHEINRELERGNDVEIRCTAYGLVIKSHAVQVVKKKKATAAVAEGLR